MLPTSAEVYDRSVAWARAKALDPRGTARFCAVTIVLLVLLGAMKEALPFVRVFSRLADLDEEYTPASAFSALVLIAAAAAYLSLVRLEAVPRIGDWLVVLFAFMGLDEWAGLHEQVEIALGFDWQYAYAPLILAAGIGWLATVRAWWAPHRSSVLCLAGGAVLWALAQAGEALVHARDLSVTAHSVEVVVEETFEMVGSSLFLLSALLVAQSLRAALPRA